MHLLYQIVDHQLNHHLQKHLLLRKRGRKPCSNPSPQALRQRAYRLRKQMKKIQNEANGQPEETNINDTSSPQEINENISSLSAHEHFIAEILINLKQEKMH